MTEVSCELARKKLERGIEEVIKQIDKDDNKRMTYDMVGEFMHIAGIYKILYNPKYKGDYIVPSGVINEETFSQNMVLRRRRENKFQINFWKKVNTTHDKYISTKLFKRIIMMLYETNSVQIDILADRIEGNLYYQLDLIANFDEDGDIGRKVKKYSLGTKKPKEVIWTSLKFIKSFKKLNSLPFHVAVNNWMKTKELKRLKRPSNSFSPKISSQSQALDELQFSKYMKTFSNNIPTPNIPSEDWTINEVSEEKANQLGNDDSLQKISRVRSRSGSSYSKLLNFNNRHSN